MKDKNSTAIFDDWTHNPSGPDHRGVKEFEIRTWTQVCEECAIKHNLLDTYLDIDSGSGICGVVGCEREADHYYDFDGEETKEVKQNHIQQDHVESNPLYEAVLKDTLETVENAIMTLECSKAHSKDWHVWRAYRSLIRLRDRLNG